MNMIGRRAAIVTRQLRDLTAHRLVVRQELQLRRDATADLQQYRRFCQEVELGQYRVGN